MNWLITNLIAAFLLPPLSFLVLGTLGMSLLSRMPRLAKTLICAMLMLIATFSLPAVGYRLLILLERAAHTPAEKFHDAQAIVVLGGGTYFNAPEYGGDTVPSGELPRLRLAAALHRRTALPLVVTGGSPDGGNFPEAILMKKTLEEDFSVRVQWVEGASDNTRQSAINSSKLLSSVGIRTIVLVTHGWHMPRARRIFERSGFRVIPAGTSFHGGHRLTLLDFLPSAVGLESSATFAHETIGLLWYWLAD